MLIRLISLLVIIISLAACSNQSKTYKLRGHVEGLAEGELVYLYDNDKKMEVDSVTSRESNFSFTGSVEETSLFYIVIKRGEDDVRYKGFWLENAGITIKGNVDDMKNALVEGSEMQKQQDEYDKNTADLNSQFDSLYTLYNPDDIELANRIDAQIDSLTEIENIEKIKFIKAYPNYSFSAYLATRLVRSLSAEEGQEVYASLSVEQQKSKYGITTKEFLDLNKNLGIGDAYVELELPNAKGEMLNLSSFKEKYVLIDFWASWCNPCRRESPYIKDAYIKYKEKGFEVYAVSLDKDVDKWLLAIAEDEMSWTTVLADGAFNSKPAMIYGVKYIPFNYLIDPDGKIIDMHLRGEKLLERLEALLGS